MKILEELLEGENLPDFVSRHFARFPYARPAAAKAYLSSLDDDALESMYAQNKSVFRVIHDFQMVEDPFQGSYAELQAYLESQHSLVIRYAQKSSEELGRLARDFENSFGKAVDIQAFITPQELTTFDWHYDLEEVFIIQTQGEKTFYLRQNSINPRPTRENMKADLGYESEQSKNYLSCHMKAGDWLYIPSGWWHKAVAATDSRHLSVGVMPFR